MTSPIKCNACGHFHAGRALAYICIGCPCMVRPDEVDAIRSAQRPARSDTEQRKEGQLAARLEQIRKGGW